MFSSKETSKMGKNAKHQHNQVAGARAGRKRNSTCNPINATILKKLKTSSQRFMQEALAQRKSEVRLEKTQATFCKRQS